MTNSPPAFPTVCDELFGSRSATRRKTTKFGARETPDAISPYAYFGERGIKAVNPDAVFIANS